MIESVARLAERLQLPLADEALARAALTHKSYVNEHRGEILPDNERLEFLGDAVIDLAVSHRLMERFPAAREGELSKLRAMIVNEAGLYEIAAGLGLGELLLLGRGEELTGGREKPSLLADALEAVIAVIYLGGGMPQVLEFVDRFFGPALDRAASGVADRDYKTQVQELSQGRFHATPRYRVVEERGPDHLKTFAVEVTVGGAVFGRGEGRSKKDAEQTSARAALEALAQGLFPAPAGLVAGPAGLVAAPAELLTTPPAAQAQAPEPRPSVLAPELTVAPAAEAAPAAPKPAIPPAAAAEPEEPEERDQAGASPSAELPADPPPAPKAPRQRAARTKSAAVRSRAKKGESARPARAAAKGRASPGRRKK